MTHRPIAALTALAVSAVLAGPSVDAAPASRPRADKSEPVVVQVRGGGFHWGDAAAGAAAALGAVLVGAGVRATTTRGGIR